MESADYWRGRNDKKSDERATMILYAAAFIAITILFWIVPSHFEAKTYSKLTGANVSTWDAMWVELRVQEAIPGDQRVQ